MMTQSRVLAHVFAAALALAASKAAFAGADVKPIALTFEEIAAKGGEFPQPAYERVVLTLKNVGNYAAGHTWAELCPNSPSGQLFCIYYVNNTIKGLSASKMEYAVSAKQYLPGATFTWELGLPPHSLSHCGKAVTSIDTNKKLGQFGSPNPYANDTQTLVAHQIGNPNLCFPWPFKVIESEEEL